ncbi:unnamed protein product [Bursaphelenchus xylophilus]|uniref:(pine wood nematode) hypothetical protein n=1 Tax=Bursaphelenchus xylophilus TaxID=6326 RepID=A0A1I7SES8_BURXY|nr:unnamed protein product [Bursaphelenchus xylophilus]CAG9118769.1 unnamed protein product [Bursaphelenchus xylophilus]
MEKTEGSEMLANSGGYEKQRDVMESTSMLSDHDPDNETFFRRHRSNLIHFLVEDWFISAMLGIITAILSILVDIGYEYLNHSKVIIYDLAMDISYIVGYGAWSLYTMSLVLCAAMMCKYISRQAIGSGIPEVKVIMNGFMLQNYLTFKTLMTKIFGLTLTLGSGLPLGKEGPFVHMGAIVATLLSKATKRFHQNAFYTNEGRDAEILSRGCAVGIACTFSAPAGAVMYAIECTHKYFAVTSYWRSFFAATCAALLFRFANGVIIPPNMSGCIVAYYQTSFPNEVFVVEEVPVFALIGLLCGLLGAAFILLHKTVHKFVHTNKYFQKCFGTDKFAFTIFVAFVVAFITFPGGMGKYVHGRYTFHESLSDLISNCTWSLYGTNNTRACGHDLVYRWSTDKTLPSPDFFPTLFLTVPFCLTLAVPNGIFIPAFVLGACGGRIIGEIMVLLFPEGMRGPGGPQIYPGLYAVVGAAAYTGAVTHSLSIAVIVCETTGQLSPLLPVLIALMIANAVASFLQPNIYESIIILKKYPHLAELPPSRISVHTLKVEQIMVKDIVYIHTGMTYRELREMLISTPQLRSYPLVNNDDDRILLGSVSRKYLNFMLTVKIGADPTLLKKRLLKRSSCGNMYSNNLLLQNITTGSTLLSSSPLHEARRQSVKHTLYRSHKSKDLDCLGLNSTCDPYENLEKTIDVNSLAIDSAPFQLVLGTSLYKVHTLFSLLGLNHAYVTNRGRLVGVVALRELRLALADIYVKGAVPLDCSSSSINRINNHVEDTDDAEIMRPTEGSAEIENTC